MSEPKRRSTVRCQLYQWVLAHTAASHPPAVAMRYQGVRGARSNRTAADSLASPAIETSA
jgi:hypothetical protein